MECLTSQYLSRNDSCRSDLGTRRMGEPHNTSYLQLSHLRVPMNLAPRLSVYSQALPLMSCITGTAVELRQNSPQTSRYDRQSRFCETIGKMRLGKTTEKEKRKEREIKMSGKKKNSTITLEK